MHRLTSGKYYSQMRSFYPRDVVSGVFASLLQQRGWLAGWLGGCLSQPVLYQNG